MYPNEIENSPELLYIVCKMTGNTRERRRIIILNFGVIKTKQHRPIVAVKML